MPVGESHLNETGEVVRHTIGPAEELCSTIIKDIKRPQGKSRNSFIQKIKKDTVPRRIIKNKKQWAVTV